MDPPRFVGLINQPISIGASGGRFPRKTGSSGRTVPLGACVGSLADGNIKLLRGMPFRGRPPQRLWSSAFVMTVQCLLLGISVWPPFREAISNGHCGRATIRLSCDWRTLLGSPRRRSSFGSDARQRVDERRCRSLPRVVDSSELGNATARSFESGLGGRAAATAGLKAALHAALGTYGFGDTNEFVWSGIQCWWLSREGVRFASSGIG